MSYEAEMGPGNGTREKPFYAIQLALADVVRNRGERRAEIVLLPGEYEIGSTLELQALGGGSQLGVLRSEGSGVATIVDGWKVPPGRFVHVKDPAVRARLHADVTDRVLVADLNGLGIPMPNVNRPYEFSAPLPLPDVVIDGRRFFPARWPNDGWSTIKRINDNGKPAVKGKTKGVGITFTYEGDAPARWQTAPYVWLQGYWAYDWNERVIPVREIFPERQMIRLLVAHEYGVPNARSNATPRRWRALHLLEELDSPGEFFLDVTEKRLYILPRDGWDPMTSVVRVSSEWRSAIFAKDTAGILIQGISFKGSYGAMANFKNCRDICIQGCDFTDARGCGVVFDHCANSRIADCDFHGLGAGAIRAWAGNRAVLTSGGNVIENNHIWDCAELAPNSLMLDVGGVGTIVRHNLIENVPHIAIRLGGNDNVIEYNVFRNCCRETDDASVIYKGRNPSCTGNVIRWNYFDEARSIHASNLGTSAIYFDDGDCGDLVYGCVFRKCGPSFRGRDGRLMSMGCVFSHWGFEARVENCLFIDCGSAVASAPCDDKHWKKTIDSMKAKLTQEVDVEGALYTSRYPWIKGLTTPQDGMRRDNFVKNCVAVRCELPPRGAWVTNETYVTFANDPGFVDEAKGDFRLKSTSEVYRRIPGFAEIPFEKMGLMR